MIDYGLLILAHLLGDYVLQNDWQARQKTSSSVACAVHVLLYTLVHVAVVETFASWPWWAYVAIAVPHFVVDRWGLAGWWMKNVSGQSRFYSAMSPWSVVVVDNTFHLLTSAVVFYAVT